MKWSSLGLSKALEEVPDVGWWCHHQSVAGYTTGGWWRWLVADLQSAGWLVLATYTRQHHVGKVTLQADSDGQPEGRLNTC